MRKVIAAMNMTLDGICDHTAMMADDQIHQHYADLLSTAGTLLYGRITYLLMEDYWPSVVAQPTGNQATDDFALAIDRLSKVVFSNTLTSLQWETAQLATADLKDEVLRLREQPGKAILVGSPSLIISLLNLGLVDEFQICIHPVLQKNGLALFKNIQQQISLTLFDTKVFSQSGAVLLCYKR